MNSYRIEDAIMWDHSVGLWPPGSYTISDDKPRVMAEPRERDSCYPQDIFPGKDRVIQNDSLGPFEKGLVGSAKSGEKLYSGIIGKKYNIKKMPLSYLVCGRFSGLSVDDILKTYEKCDERNCCDVIAKKVTKSIIGGLSSKIFSNTEQPYIELVANAADASGKNGAVGKFGIGFFSALSLIQNHPLVIISATSDTLIHLRIYNDSKGEYFFDLTTYKYEGESGTFMIVEGSTNIKSRYNMDNIDVYTKQLLDLYADRPGILHTLIADRGVGINEQILFDKLLLPSLSTKKTSVFTKNLFEINGRYFSRLMVNNYVIFLTKKIYGFDINLSNRYNVPLSRDDLLLSETDFISLNEFLIECEQKILGLGRIGKKTLASFLEVIDLFSSLTKSPTTRKLLKDYLHSENIRHPIKTTLFEVPADPFYYGTTFYVKRTQDALIKHYPGQYINGIYAIKDASLPMPTNGGFPGLIFYGKDESLIPFRLSMKNYVAELKLSVDPIIAPLIDTLVYCLKEKYNQTNVEIAAKAAIDRFTTLISRPDCEEIVSSLIACYKNFELDHRYTFNGTFIIYMPPYFTTEEFIEAINFIHKRSHLPRFFIPYTSTEYDGPRLALEDYLRSDVTTPESMFKAARAKIFYDANGLRIYPNFMYGLYDNVELQVPNDYDPIIAMGEIYQSSGKCFSLKDQISAAFTQKEPIADINSLLKFIQKVGLKTPGSKELPKVDYVRNDIELLRLAINYGTPRPYLESVLYELCQNAKDAGSKTISCRVQKVDDEYFKLIFRDFARGIPISAYLSLSIPFYSEKGSNSVGKIGSGFFNIYKNAVKVVIMTYSGKDKPFRMTDVPVRVNEEVVDVERFFEVEDFKEGKIIGTTIEIVLRGGEEVRQYYNKMAHMYESIYNRRIVPIYSADGYKISRSSVNQMFITIEDIPYSPATYGMLPSIANYTILDLSSRKAGTNQSRTIETPIYIPHQVSSVKQCLYEISPHGSRVLSNMMLYSDMPKNGRLPWSLFPQNASTYDEVVEGIENIKSIIPGMTEYGIRHIKTQVRDLLKGKKVLMEDFASKNLENIEKRKSKGGTSPQKKLLEAFGGAWNELAIKKGVYKNPVNVFRVNRFEGGGIVGLYELRTRTITIDPSRIKNASGLIKKIQTMNYEKIIEDPDWKFMFSVDSYPSKTIFHELEHHRAGTEHSGTSHDDRENIKVSTDLFLPGKYSFDRISSEIAKYMFCNGLYDLIRKRL